MVRAEDNPRRGEQPFVIYIHAGQGLCYLPEGNLHTNLDLTVKNIKRLQITNCTITN